MNEIGRLLYKLHRQVSGRRLQLPRNSEMLGELSTSVSLCYHIGNLLDYKVNRMVSATAQTQLSHREIINSASDFIYSLDFYGEISDEYQVPSWWSFPSTKKIGKIDE